MEVSELNGYDVFETSEGRPCVVREVKELIPGTHYAGLHMLDGKEDRQYLRWEKVSEMQHRALG